MLKKIVFILAIIGLTLLSSCVTVPTGPERTDECKAVPGEPHPLTGVQELIIICEE